MSGILHQKASRRIHELLHQAQDHFRQSMPQVEVRFDLKGTTAGQAKINPGSPPVIRLNQQLMEQNPERFLERTVPHEVAHVVAYSLHCNIKPHGAEWKQIMSFSGADARRCHDYDITHARQRKLQRFDYRCECRSHSLTSIRHNRVQRGQRYFCRACKQPLIPGPL